MWPDPCAGRDGRPVLRGGWGRVRPGSRRRRVAHTPQGGGITFRRARVLPRLLAAALLAAGCTDAFRPERRSHGLPALATTAATGITLDQQNSTAGAINGTTILKGFNPTNPHRGDAIVATFFWTGSATITAVSHPLADGTPLGNTSTLLDNVPTARGTSIATYSTPSVAHFRH